MNRFLLLLGSLLLLALTTALIAPRFIDWSNYTDIIEEQASRVLGREVHVSGAVDLRFLPMPRIIFSDVEIASDADGSQPGFTARRMEALMSLAPFLSGETHIVELTLDSPTVRLAALGEGMSQIANETLDLGAVRIDEATIVDGRIERIAPDGSVQVLMEGLNASLSAPSLLGPWRVDPGSAIIAGERVSLRVNTGAYGGERRMRMRVAVLPVTRPMEITVDGHLDWSQANAFFEGRGVARSLDDLVAETDVDTQPLTWRVAADVVAALDGLDADGIELSLGQAQDQAFVLNGRAHVNLGERPAFNAEISSRQVDLDRMLGGGAADPVNLDAGWASAGTLVRWIDQMTVPGEVSFDIPAIVLGGSVIRDIGFNATYSPGLPVSLENLVATFPGETSFGFTGAVGAVGDVAGTDLALDGIMTLESAAPDLFVGWSTGRRDEGGTFSQLSSVDLRGRVVAAPGDVSIERLRGQIDGAALEGSLAYREVAGLGGQMDVDLNAGRFDFGLLAGLGRWLTHAGGSASDGPLIDTLNADLVVQELVAGAEDLGEVTVSVAATPDRIRIDELAIGDAVGASVSASGFVERGAFPPVGQLAVNADMDRLGGLLRLARDVFGDNPVLLDLYRNAGLYEPASLAGSYNHDASSGVEVSLVGSLGGSEVDLFGAMPPDGTQTLPTGLASLFDRAAELRFEARSDDAYALVGQLGVAALPIELTGEGSAVASLVSDGESAPQLRFAFDGLDTTLRLDATLEGDADDGIRAVEGLGSLFAGDVAQLGLMAGMAVPGLFDPISAAAVFDVTYDVGSETAALSGLSGTFADVPVSGAGRVERGPLGTSVALDLSADEVDLRGVLAGFLGPSAFDQGFSSTWPEGPLVFNPVPVDLSLTLATPRLAIWDGLIALDGTLALAAEEGRLTLERLQGEVFGGEVDARLVLRDADRGGIAEGRLALTDLDVARFAWERDGQPVMDGRLSANLSFESAGGSMASLISGLTGDGTLALADTTVTGLGLTGFSRILQASDAGLLGEDDDLEAAFADALSAGTMRIEAADTPLSVVGGVAQFSNLYLEGGETALRGGLTVDLSTNAVDADFSYAAVDGPGDVEAMPNVGLSFAGPLASPEKQLDVSQISSFLNVRQLELEIRRVEALNAEILERERLLRIMAAVDLDQTRLEFEREENLRIEQERLEEEARERARIAEERQAAEDAARQADEERERALREALLARETEQQNLPSTPTALDLTLPPLEPITVPRNPLAIGESPPPATSAPLDLTPR
jgi:hypothetical protein